MTIEDRPVNQFELDCIIKAQERLRKDAVYIGLLKDQKTMHQEIRDCLKKISIIDWKTQTTSALQLVDILGALIEKVSHLKALSSEIGFWDGKEFCMVAIELSKDPNISSERLKATMAGRDH